MGGCPNGYEVLTDLEECKDVVGELTWDGPNQSGQLAFYASECRPDWIATLGCFTNKSFYEKRNFPAGHMVFFNTCPGATTPSWHQPICKRDSTSTACPALKCTLHCDTGYVMDANGCETCECKPQVYVRSTGICAPHHAPGTGLSDWANKDLDTCKSMCDNDPSCTSFHYHNLSGPNHHVQHRCIFKSTSRGCTEQEQQEAEQLYRDLGLDCCLDKSCIDNQVIPGAINWSYQYGWHCMDTYMKAQYVPTRRQLTGRLLSESNSV